MKKSYILSASVMIMSLAAGAAYAQSTGTETVETVVVKGTRNVGILQKETGIKTKVTIDQTMISQASAGQTIADILNTVPGYNFTNNDPYGSSGGTITMRGISGDKVSLTFDGAQLNDAGNYAIYTNQLLEPELICKASVNTGATDIDSLTGSAIGGTVNFSTCKPNDKFGGVLKYTGGDWNFKNAFARVDSGKIGPWGTKAYIAYTDQSYSTWTREAIDDPKLTKQQANFLVHQDLFGNGSFVSLAGHYNKNRNIFYSAYSKAALFGTPTATSGYDWNGASLTSINPSDTGNLRGKSKWVFSDKLTLTVDPTYQYTMATGGSTTTMSETDPTLCGSHYGTAGCGVDLNKNGTIASSQTSKLYQGNITNTNRFSITSSLIYDFAENQRVRLGASYENARTRQTGERVVLNADGSTPAVFGAKNKEYLAIIDNDGNVNQRRNRYSKAMVNVFSAEYIGGFLEEKLFATAAVRFQKMERDLNQYCYSKNDGTGSFSPYCSSEKATLVSTTPEGYKLVTLASKGTTLYVAPYSKDYSFDKTLFNAGLTYKVTPADQVYGNFSQAMSSPKTDNYYAIKINPTTLVATVSNPSPEVNNSFELGYRHTNNNLYATATIYYAKDKDRLVSAYDEALGLSIDTNVGDVVRTGFEAQASYKVLPNFSLNASYSYTNAEMQNDMPSSKAGATIPTKGKQLVETPKNMATFGMTYDFASQLHFNLNGKYVGERFSTYVNDDAAPEYTVWSGSLRYDFMPTRPGTYLQVNVVNLFDTKYLGSINNKQNTALGILRSDGTTEAAATPTFYAGAPRTFQVGVRTTF